MLVYNPSKDSGFGHAGRPRSLIKLIPQVSRFLEQFTFHSEAQDVSIQVFRATDYDLEDHSERYVKEVTSCFGPCSNDGDFFLSRLGDAPKPMNYRWELQGDLLGKATDFLLSGPPYPKQLFGPVRLSYFFNFSGKIRALVCLSPGILTPSRTCELTCKGTASLRQNYSSHFLFLMNVSMRC